jgi:hypothetical protein
MWMVLFTLFWNGNPEEGRESQAETPLVLILEMAQEFAAGSEVWFDVAYLAQPSGETLFREPGERLWWLQNRAILVLGSTGLPLPAEVYGRATVWVRLIADDGREFGPFELNPRQDGVILGADMASLAKKLGQRLAGIDSSYLVQVAHFLANNLSALNVVGSSYEVSGFGPVIDSSGAWVGGKLNVGAAPLYNVAVGSGALYYNTTGNYNTALGYLSLYYNTSGYDNTAVGRSSLYNNTTGYYNTALGNSSLHANTTGHDNTALGRSSLLANTTGSDNTALGRLSLYSNTTGQENTAIGRSSLYNNTTGSANTAIGRSSLNSNTTGAYNTALGYYAGQDLVSGSFNTFVGRATYTTNGAISNSMALGDAVSVTASNQVRIGNAGVSSIGGQVGWTTLSDGRFKRNVREDVPGLDFIRRLRPVTYELDRAAISAFLSGSGEAADTAKGPEPSTPESGFIAQEVETAVQKTGFSFSGVDVPANEQTPYGLRYGQFVVPLVKAVQEQDQVLSQQAAEITTLKAENAQQAGELAELKARTAELAQLKADIAELKRLLQQR